MNGEIKKTLVIYNYGDRDVNGVAISASKIVFGDDNNNIAAFSWDFDPIWIFESKGDFEGAPSFLFVNNDIILDVVAATEAGEVVVLDGENGHDLCLCQPLYPTYYIQVNAAFTSPSVIDINKDSFKDILIGCRNGLFML